jgi:hypothetical protein
MKQSESYKRNALKFRTSSKCAFLPWDGVYHGGLKSSNPILLSGKLGTYVRLRPTTHKMTLQITAKFD